MDREKQAEIARLMTGSNMNTQAIITNVINFVPETKEVICPEVYQMTKDRNMPFDKAYPLIKDGFNEIAQNNNIDPAVLFWVYMDWLRDYNESKK